jgi:hypothetical protein
MANLARAVVPVPTPNRDRRGSRDQRHRRARRQWEDMDARRRIGESGGQVSHGLSLFLRDLPVDE